MQHSRPGAALPGLAAVAALVAACGGGHTVSVGKADRDCTAVVQAANTIQIVGTHGTASDVSRAGAGAAALTTAASSATTAVAGPAGQLAAAARSYAEALRNHDVEGINVSGGLLRQKGQQGADTRKQTRVRGAPPGPS